MPSYVQNFVVVAGPRARLEAFVAQAACGTDLFSLHALIPIPAELRETKTDEARQAQAAWVDEHWGAYALADAVHGAQVEDKGDAVRYQFVSCWESIVPALAAISREHPELRFFLAYDVSICESWYDPGTAWIHRAFAGGIVYDAAVPDARRSGWQPRDFAHLELDAPKRRLA